MPTKHTGEERKRFSSLIPRLLRRIAKARWRNNSPVVTLGNEEDAVKALLMNKMLDHWWKQGGGHKKVWNKIKQL